MKGYFQDIMIKTFYRNRLPHLVPIGATFFVTFRLADSLPLKVLTQIKKEYEFKIQQLYSEQPKNYQWLIQKTHKQFYAKFDNQLDRSLFGECHLKNPEIAKTVTDKLRELDGELYDLHAYCIMPNHVHLLIDTFQQLLEPDGTSKEEIPKDYIQLDMIMKRIKGSTARTANLQLNRSGTFWQKDSYDHFVRNEREWRNIVAYILNNPVKAKLVDNWNDWDYTYCKYQDV